MIEDRQRRQQVSREHGSVVALAATYTGGANARFQQQHPRHVPEVATDRFRFARPPPPPPLGVPVAGDPGPVAAAPVAPVGVPAPPGVPAGVTGVPSLVTAATAKKTDRRSRCGSHEDGTEHDIAISTGLQVYT
jgi:hypothetical protein